MTDEIQDRPANLEKLQFYSELPQMPVGFDLSTIHDFLLFDMHDLDGIQPIEFRRWPKAGEGYITVQPPDYILDEYERENILFQVVSVVVNAFSFKSVNGNLIGKPYAISLIPWSKRGKVSKISPVYFKSVNLESLSNKKMVYMHYNPFLGPAGLFGEFNTFLCHGPFKVHTDMVGFVFNTYALASRWTDDIAMAPMYGSNDFLKEKYRKYRIKRYFTNFDDVKPRKIWGCDSPIELFLLYALDHVGLLPEIQTSIYEDGSIYPSLHHMISENRVKDSTRIITEADFYLPEQKIAIFCDSSLHHRGKAKEKDSKIDSQLSSFGIRSVRIQGRDIVADPFKCASVVQREMQLK